MHGMSRDKATSPGCIRPKHNILRLDILVLES
jgi:hypothetical protein